MLKYVHNNCWLDAVLRNAVACRAGGLITKPTLHLRFAACVCRKFQLYTQAQSLRQAFSILWAFGSVRFPTPFVDAVASGRCTSAPVPVARVNTTPVARELAPAGARSGPCSSSEKRGLLRSPAGASSLATGISRSADFLSDQYSAMSAPPT
jgi:hypothetical protein